MSGNMQKMKHKAKVFVNVIVAGHDNNNYCENVMAIAKG